MTDSTANDDPLVPNPTWTGNIRAFFTDPEIGCMNQQGIDLSSYDSVRGHSTDIYEQTKVGNMPYGGPRWSDNRVRTFLNWIRTGFPKDSDSQGDMPHPDPTPVEVRLRKNIHSLKADEMETLKKAFRGIMALDPTDPSSPVNPRSYFGLAAVHGLPLAFCMHHVNSYNPWHRVYVTRFEDALRSIDGCSDVTLPYWDIKTPVPAELYEEPFATYTLPRDIGDPQDYPAGYTTVRNDPDTIWKKLTATPSVASAIDDALPSVKWGAFHAGGFQQYIIEAHDDGHDSCGDTMSDQDVAAYDPIFWFFHCNWERMFQSWQTRHDAATVPGFTATLDGDTDWLPLELDPYPEAAEQVISYPQITYEKLDLPSETTRKAGRVDALRAFTVEPDRVSVRVEDIDRMNIPGTFVVRLLADGEPIARRIFFQPRSPETCKTCRTQALVSLDFRIDRKLIEGRTLSVAIEARALARKGEAVFPLSRAGQPKINVRLLLEES